MSFADSKRDSSPPRIGQYELIARLGSGGMGTVYKARHTGLKRMFALKILSPHRAHDPGAVERFKREMAALGKLIHPNIAFATDANEADGFYFIAMEYVEGADLARVLRHARRLSVPDACEIARQTAEGLAFIHEREMIHRDIKPSNLLLGEDGLVRVLDLGLARIREPMNESEKITLTGAVMGTADFIAPEQARDSRDVDIRADIYSLGCTLFALLSGASPVAAEDSVYEKFKAHHEKAAPSVRSLVPEVPEELAQLIARMLEKDAAARPATPADLARELQAFCTGHDLKRLLAAVGVSSELPIGKVANFQRLPDGPATTGTFQAEPETVTLTATAHHGNGFSRRRRLTFAFIALAVALAIWFAWPPKVETNDEPLPRVPQIAARAFKPGEWTELLDRPPVRRVWPEEPGISRLVADESKHELFVDCSQFSVLELAALQAEAFDVDARFTQNGWTIGRFGVFVRGRIPKEENRQHIWVADTLFLQSLDLQSPQATVARMSLGLFDEAGKHNSVTSRTFLIPRPEVDEHSLAFTVDATGISNVKWNDLEAMSFGNLPDMNESGAAFGSVGVVVQNSNVLFRSVRVRPHQTRGAIP